MATNPYAVSSGSTTGLASGSAGAAVSEREDLANFISMITRDETPFMSSIGKTKADAVWHEWQTDALAAPSDSSVAPGADIGEVRPDFNGGDPVGTNTTPDRTRLGNRTQINSKTVAVSGTKRAVDQAGVADEYAYQLRKRGVELRRDVERHLLMTNQGSDNASASGGSLFGGVSSWLQHAVGTAVTDANSKEVSPTGTVLYKDGGGTANVETAAPAANVATGRAGIRIGATDTFDSLDLSDIDDVMQAIYEAGGSASKVMLSPKNRRAFSAKAQASSGTLTGSGAGNVRRNIDEGGKLRQSVDFYLSDFGEIMVEANYVMGLGTAQPGTATSTRKANDSGQAYSSFYRDSWALVYDPMWFNIATLRPMQEVDVGQRGDSTIGMMIEECTLEMKNPVGCGAIYGLNGS